MEQKEQKEFFAWLRKTKFTELDIINCRKMQSVSIVENENIFGISTISVCGFINNDVVKVGAEIKQQYSENKHDFYERAFSILHICAKLMDSVNGVLADEGSWTNSYFEEKFVEWKNKSLKNIS